MGTLKNLNIEDAPGTMRVTFGEIYNTLFESKIKKLEERSAFSTVQIGDADVSANAPTDTLVLEAGVGIAITPDEENKHITIAVDSEITQATYDGAGNNIVETYSTKKELGDSIATTKKELKDSIAVTEGKLATTNEALDDLTTSYNSTVAEIQTQLVNTAQEEHSHTASDITGTLGADQMPVVPITKGGTGANEAMYARANLEVAHAIEDETYEGCYYRWDINHDKEWINPPMIENVEYQTTERYNGQPVYTRLINFGALPAASESNWFSLNDMPNSNYPIPFCIDGMATSSGGMITTINSLPLTIEYTAGQISITAAEDLSYYTAYLTVKYTRPDA